MLLWGIVATLMGVCTNYAGFLAARFFLGVTESGLFPGVVFYLSMWYKRTETHYRVALFFSASVDDLRRAWTKERSGSVRNGAVEG